MGLPIKRVSIWRSPFDWPAAKGPPRQKAAHDAPACLLRVPHCAWSINGQHPAQRESKIIDYVFAALKFEPVSEREKREREREGLFLLMAESRSA